MVCGKGALAGNHWSIQCIRILGDFGGAHPPGESFKAIGEDWGSARGLIILCCEIPSET